MDAWAREPIFVSLREHWPEYLMEAALLGVYMMSAGIFAVLLQNAAVSYSHMDQFAASSPAVIRRRARSDFDQTNLFAMGPTVRRPCQFSDHVRVLAAWKDWSI